MENPVENQLVDKQIWHVHEPVTEELKVEIQTRSKKRLMEWWKHRTNSFPIRHAKGVVDAGKIIRFNENAYDIIGGIFHIIDYETQEFPFPLNVVDTFMLEMPELHNLKNCPIRSKVAQFGSRANKMNYMDNLIGCPQFCESLFVHTKVPFLNLENSLKEPVQLLSINAPSIKSFHGLDVHVEHVELIVRQQKSFKGIHKHLKNIGRLSIGVEYGFDGGLLPLAMLDPEIIITGDPTSNSPPDVSHAIDIIGQGRHDQLNTHDIQELLIDSGYEKYARL